MTDFARATNDCKNSVSVEAREGDVLDLKSELCKHAFLALSIDPKYLESSKVSYTPRDAALLIDYIEVP